MKLYILSSRTNFPDEFGLGVRSALEGLSRFNDQEAYLRGAYELITTRYESRRIKTVTHIHQVFAKDVDHLWGRTGFSHCISQNYLLALLLVKGGLFIEEDIKPKWTAMWCFFGHQYLQVRVEDGKTIDVDPWGKHYGIPFGKHARGFNSKLMRTQ